MEQNPYQPPASDVKVEQTDEQGLAGRGIRLAAAIIDTLLIMAIFLPLAIYASLIDFSDLEAGQSLMQNVLLTAIGFCIFLALHGYLLARNGQTIGKLLFKIKIVRRDGSKASLGRIVGLRLLPMWVAASIPIVANVVPLIDSLLIFRKSRSCLHDDIADTKVVKIVTQGQAF